MGPSISREEELQRFKQQLPTPPDLTVDRNLQMLTGRSCSDNLKLHLEKRMEEFSSKAPDIVKALVEKLAGLSPSPELAGLGALAVAIFIDIHCDTDSTKDALREALAEQKVSEVWDLVDETLKRCEMNLKNKKQLASDLQRLEAKLSMGLTRLKNSMLRDGHMTSQALKVWVNGAAFHLHMLIHQQRLEGPGSWRLWGATSRQQVERLIPIYKDDLEKLFRKHEEMIMSRCSIRPMKSPRGHPGPNYLVIPGCQRITESSSVSLKEYLQVFYQHQYGRQEEEIQHYFSEIQQDLQQLLGQKGQLSFK